MSITVSTPPVTINLVVLNGEKYIRYCLDAVLAQTYPHKLIELNILDNGSNDNTKSIIAIYNQQLTTSNFVKFFLLESKKNLGVWPGQEALLKHTNSKYIVALCVDVVLDKNFIRNAVEILEKDKKIGALQPKIYKFDLRPTSEKEGTPHQSDPLGHHNGSEIGAGQASDVKVGVFTPTSQIDTCGFQIFRSRRVINIGHGEEDRGQYDNLGEIFAVEGAVPVFRKEALENCKVSLFFAIAKNRDTYSPVGSITNPAMQCDEITDHDYFWYGDDLDLAWRMRLFGWKEIFAPNVIAWHDRQTTKSIKKHWLDYFLRIPTRQQIPIKKRRLDWRNMRFTLVKNDYIINALKDLPGIFYREIAVLGYTVLFEPAVLKEIPIFFQYLPKMLRKRKEIMKRAVVDPKEIRKWMK